MQQHIAFAEVDTSGADVAAGNRRLAQAKERSEAAFRTLVEAAPCMIVILRPDHSVLYLSRFAEELTGRAAAEVVAGSYDAKGHGLSVTPNLLHGTLAAQTLGHLSESGQDPVSVLLLAKAKRPVSVAWTEYSLYTSVAEYKGNLFDYHVDWNTCYAADIHLFSEQSCVWGADDFERLVKLPNGTDPGGKFIIVQSHARIPLERVREYCLSFAS